MEIDKLTFYTDGAYSPSTKCGGWGFYCPELVLRVGNKELNTTNNRMEINAYLKVLEFIKKLPHKVRTIEIITDSQYLIGTRTLNWKRNINNDLWNLIDQLEYQISSIITFTKIKGHSNNYGNEVVDRIANRFSQLNIK